MPQNPHVLLTFGEVQNPWRLLHETTLWRPKVARTCGALYMLTSKRALRHNCAHFFDISTSKSGPTLRCFVHFDFEICFAPHGVCTVSTSQLPTNPSVFDTFDFDMSCAPQRRALFRHLYFQKWSEHGVLCTFWLGNVLRATTACNFSSLIWPDGSAPAALASLRFDRPKPQIIAKTQWIATFLGVWGLRVCSLDVAYNRWQPSATVRNHPQQFATVRNRSRDPRMAVPMVSSAEGDIFVGFKRRVAAFRVAGVSLHDIQTCFVTCRKSFCVAGAILLRRFRKIRCSFRGRRSTLELSSIILRGRRSTLDVSCCVFFESHCQGCVKWGQGANSVADVAFCEMWWKLTELRTKRFWSSKFSGS